MVHSTDIVEFELRSKKFSLAVRKKEAVVQPEPMYLPVCSTEPLDISYDLHYTAQVQPYIKLKMVLISDSTLSKMPKKRTAALMQISTHYNIPLSQVTAITSRTDCMLIVNLPLHLVPPEGMICCGYPCMHAHVHPAHQGYPLC